MQAKADSLVEGTGSAFLKLVPDIEKRQTVRLTELVALGTLTPRSTSKEIATFDNTSRDKQFEISKDIGSVAAFADSGGSLVKNWATVLETELTEELNGWRESEHAMEVTRHHGVNTAKGVSARKRLIQQQLSSVNSLARYSEYSQHMLPIIETDAAQQEEQFKGIKARYQHVEHLSKLTDFVIPTATGIVMFWCSQVLILKLRRRLYKVRMKRET